MHETLIKRLRDTPNWLKQSYGHWKDVTNSYDRAPFEAADALEVYQVECAELRKECNRLKLLNERLINEARKQIDKDIDIALGI